MSAKLQFHPNAEIFPLMACEEFDKLVEDIKAHGLREPLWLHPDGRIIDGRNRYFACQKAGIEPKVRTWDEEGSLVDFIVSLNLRRRHLTESQRTCVAVRMLPLREKEAKERMAAGGGDRKSGVAPVPPPVADPGKSREKVAAQMDVSPRYVSDGKWLQQRAPDLFEAVAQGGLTISEAKRELRKAERAKQEAEAVAQVGPERLWTLTDDQAIVPCAALITDPPYGILDQPWEPKHLEKFTRDWLSRWNECGADIVLCFWSQRYRRQGEVWFDEALSNYEFQQLLIWHYANNKSPQSRQGFKQTWEPIFFYRRRDSERQINISGANWGKDLHDFDCYAAAVPQSNFNGAECKQHPAQKPVSVMRWLINATTQPGEMVCDPFAGSGTTGVAAAQLHRRFHGIEIDPGFLEIAERRIAAYGQAARRDAA
jgi:DNA methylase